MNTMLKYLAVAVLFGFSVSSHAAQVSDELARKVLAKGEPIASGRNGFDPDRNVTWAQTALRYQGEVYVCQIDLNLINNRVHAFCLDKH